MAAAALRCLVRAVNLTRLAKTTETLAPATSCFASTQVQIRSLHNCNSPKVTDLDLTNLPKFETSNDPREWQYVERLLPEKIVPQPKKFENAAPSGWVSPREEAKSLSYFIPRNRNHMQPVYLSLSYRNSRRITVVKKIQGNIWQLEEDLRKYLESKSTNHYKHIASRVNEMCGQIRFRGDHVAYVKEWMNSKGF